MKNKRVEYVTFKNLKEGWFWHRGGEPVGLGCHLNPNHVEIIIKNRLAMEGIHEPFMMQFLPREYPCKAVAHGIA